MQYQSEILKYLIKVIETLDESPNKRLQKPLMRLSAWVAVD